MKNQFSSLLLFCVAIHISNISAFAQDPTSTHTHLSNEDSLAINALVLYPDTIRMEIFEACEYPGAIVNIASLQKNSSSDFAVLVSSYPKDEQEELWNLGRYADLISKLAQGGKKPLPEINNMLKEYPQEIHNTAIKYGRNDYDVLRRMDQLQTKTNSQFEQIISEYPPITKDALRDIIHHPEIITLLNDHLNLTVRVGDHFRRDPKGVIHRADSMHLAEAAQNAKDAETWKQTIQQNPEQINDLKNASAEYAKENGYSEEEVNMPPDPNYVANYTCNPYSYWYGYPTWYPYSYWYPYPYWFDCGFYFDRAGHMVMIGAPSYYFTNWYFYYPEHWHHYPHLCNAYISHYYRPHVPFSANHHMVNNWVRDNNRYLPKDFVNNPQSRPEVIKQIGQLNMDAQKQQGSKTVSSAMRDQYFQNNAARYSKLNAERPSGTNETNRNVPEMREEPVKQPSVRISKPESQTTPVVNPKPRVMSRNNNFNNANKAQEYHRNTWEQTPSVHPMVKPQQPQPVPVRPQQPPTIRQNAPTPHSGGRKK